jgi:hypothetical protein
LLLRVWQKRTHAKGNAFGQLIHDGATLKNGKKYQALSMQMIDHQFQGNFLLCLGFIQSDKNTNVVVAELFGRVFRQRTGFELADIMCTGVNDAAAKGVNSLISSDIEEETCDMHDADKLGQSAVGALVRSKDKVEINPFVGGAVRHSPILGSS